mmetsp:Transcript_45656/g.93244  ORF Transcript_45656/g.93244 Transcript_45656/m.93244 type:complete len:388 (-) Transcript_45656:42-1205(-)
MWRSQWLCVAALLATCESVWSRHAVVHVGPHKTGTTHIQNVLSVAAKDLMSHGFAWPTTTNTKGEVHGLHAKCWAPLAWYFEGRTATGASLTGRTPGLIDSTDDAFRYFTDFFDAVNSSNVIISAEVFDRVPMEGIHKFHLFMRQFDTVTIVIVHRDPVDHFVSLYTELHSKGDVAFPDFLFRSMGGFLLDNPVLDVHWLVQKYATVFGLDNVVIVDYDGVKSAGKDIAEVLLCEVIGVPCNLLQQSTLELFNSSQNQKWRSFSFSNQQEYFVAQGLAQYFYIFSRQALNCTLEHNAAYQAAKVFLKNNHVPTQCTSLHGLRRLLEPTSARFMSIFGQNVLYPPRLDTPSFSIKELCLPDSVALAASVWHAPVTAALKERCKSSHHG